MSVALTFPYKVAYSSLQCHYQRIFSMVSQALHFKSKAQRRKEGADYQFGILSVRRLGELQMEVTATSPVIRTINGDKTLLS
jgi:hypothetical protein